MAPTVSDPTLKLRDDLIVSEQNVGPAKSFVVKEPASGRFFRFGEIEGYLLRQLNGAVTRQQLQQSVQSRFGAPLPLTTLDQFLQKLGRLDLLETEGHERHRQANERIRGNLFYLRLKAFNPDKLFDRWIGSVRFFFTPGFVCFSAILILVGGYITATHWWEIGHDFRRLYTFQSLLVAYVMMLGVITAHEFAHGLTCKFFGGSVREIGFLLLYFQPAFYCNISDAWLFPEKAKRLWVTFAGAYFEVFIWALATVIWRVTDPYTLINYLALVVLATSGIKTLFNLNPLIKLDGYYLLSDLLEMPNLRQRAFTYIRDQLRRLWSTVQGTIRNTTPRERRIYWTYGLLAWIYSTWLLSMIALYVGSSLVRKYQGWGFAVFLFLLGGLFQRPLKNMLRASFAWVKIGPTVNKWVKRLIWSCILAAGITALFVCRTDLRIAGPFLVLPVHNADVRAEVEGILQEIYVDEGDSVKKSAPIATLSDRDYQADLRKIKAEIQEKQARLNLLKAGARPEEIEVAITVASKAEERLRYATNRRAQQGTPGVQRQA
jgi:putative peptide zinc metalloprotease protein